MTDIKERLYAVRGLAPQPSSNTLNRDIRTVHEGGYIDIDGETYLVVKVYKYLDVKWKSFNRRKKEYWVTELQLSHLLSGEKTFIEWEVDDELEMSQTLSQIKMNDISCNGRPLTRTDLEDISEEEHGVVKYAGTDFHYSEDDTWAALFFRDETDEPLPVRMYEFVADNDKCLTIELWEEEDSKPEREAFISQELQKKSIAVLQAAPSGETPSEEFHEAD